MAYCTAEDVMKMLKEDMLNSIIGDEYIEDEAEKGERILPFIVEAILDADSEIDGYLSKRYNLPFSNVPAVLHKFSKDMAVYNLVARRGIQEDGPEKTILNRYHAAIKFLESVARGTVEIGVARSRESAGIGFQVKSNGRTFSRESMRGW